MKFLQAYSRVRRFIKSDVSETDSTTTLMIETQLVSETPDFTNILTRLPARKNFIEFCRRVTFNTYQQLSLFIQHNAFYVVYIVCNSVTTTTTTINQCYNGYSPTGVV